jgi:ribokinase
MGRVLVAGSINIDLVTSVPALPVPGQTVLGSELAYHPGGKGANQAVAASRAGAAVTMIGAVGDDSFGERLVAFLASNGVDTSGVVRVAGAPTGVAVIAVDARGENTIVAIPGANEALAPDHVGACTPAPGDVLAAQCEAGPEATLAFLKAGRAAGALTVLNAAPAPGCSVELLGAADVVAVNETELGALTGRAVAPDAPAADVVAAAHKLRRTDQTVVVTLGSRGAIAAGPLGVQEIPGLAVRAVDATGAGDCFVGALCARLAAGDALPGALVWANTAASLCVQRRGAGPSMPTAGEVSAAISSPPG